MQELFKNTHLKIVIVVMLVMTVLYLGMIQIWESTSEDYLPTNNIDSEVKTPENNDDWFVRRKKGN